jgi:hypothetical protein
MGTMDRLESIVARLPEAARVDIEFAMGPTEDEKYR